ncbi:tetratricopeptide repeat protein, partial [Streptomyces sp. NPDC052301]|uniref:tetratricopeptide repeat protein n=1 Tax=Streptomyces sp. NPDC052301 TaxID=3365687 RepID=UPI0037D04AD1
MVVGRAETVHQHAAPRAVVSWPHLVGRIPRQADYFQDRGAVGALDAAVAEAGTAVLCQVLTGSGGVGKTQLAAHHARTAWQAGRLDLLVWVTAASREAIIAAYAAAGTAVLGADRDRPEQAAEEFYTWLQPKPPPIGREDPRRRWMVVLDDLTDPADLLNLWPPTDNPLGQTLVTTRRRDPVLTSDSRHRVDVGLFTEVEADAYLTAALAAHGRTDPPEHIHALARGLGRLPLALAQAAAFLNNARFNEADPKAGFLPIDCPRSCLDPCTRADCVTYRKQLADRARTLDDVLPEPGTLPDDQAATVAAACSLSIDRANTLRPVGLARPMLQLTAMLDPNGIPITILTSPPALTHLSEQRTTPDTRHQDQVPVTAGDAVDALRALHLLSLLDPTTGPGSTVTHQTVRVHNLIQRAVRDPLPADRYDQLARTAADALTAAWPDVPRDTSLEQSLRANAAALTYHAADVLWRPDSHQVLYRTGTSLGETGQLTAAVNHFRHLTEDAHHRLGPYHPDTLAARGHLARWRGAAGDPVAAAAATEQLLRDRLRVLGPDHPDTLTARANLARWRGAAGDPGGAATETEQLLDDLVRVLGPDHPNTLNAINNLAYWRGTAGDPGGAATAFSQLLRDRLRVLGPDHPDTLTARANLARWRGAAG